jgi:transposase
MKEVTISVPCYHFQLVNKYWYLFESTSYWDKIKKSPRNKKHIIASYKTNTKELIFKPEFLKNHNNKSIKINNEVIIVKNQVYTNISLNKPEKLPLMPTKELENVNNDLKNINIPLINLYTIQECLGSHKKYGLKYSLGSIANKLNISKILKEIIPEYYQQILNLAYYIISENDAMMYCKYWADENGINDGFSYTSQNISKLFDIISEKQRQKFYSNWINSVREDEFLAVDITSVSSYSETIDDCEFGYYRDKENLKQINICTLFGEKSFLPTYQTEFSGSIADVNTLKTVITEFKHIIGDYNFTLVMDKGFYSQENLDFMLSKNDIDFVISVPLKNNYVKNAINLFRNDKFMYKNYHENRFDKEKIYGDKFNVVKHEKLFKILIKDSIQNINIEQNNKLDKNLYLYTFYNNINENKERDIFFEKINKAKNYILTNNKIGLYESIAKTYFKLNYSDDRKSIISIDVNEEKIDEKLRYSGYFALLSNVNKDKQYIYNIYRKRNDVELAFKNYKNYLGLDRLYIHGNKRMINKTFLLFISLIFYSYIFKHIIDSHLIGKNITIKTALKELGKIKSFNFNDIFHISPVSSLQKKILESLNVDIPDNMS